MLKPVTRDLKSPANLTALKFTEIESMEQFAQEEPKRQPLIDSDNLITEIFSKINLWKTAENAISGFNYLTEAQLSINKTTDEQGKLTGLSLNTESYTIAGKLK